MSLSSDNDLVEYWYTSGRLKLSVAGSEEAWIAGFTKEVER